MQDILDLPLAELEGACFEIDGSRLFESHQIEESANNNSFYQIKNKIYEKNGVERTMVQLVNVSQSILVEQVNAENQFLAITNATVSHELRNPLQSISCQTLKVDLCLKELLMIIKDHQRSKGQGRQDPSIVKLKSIAEIIQKSNKISDSSSKMMSFVVDDLLDYAQLDNEKFRKDVKSFKLKDAINEAVEIQTEKAIMQRIKLKNQFKPQTISHDVKPISMFSDSVDQELS